MKEGAGVRAQAGGEGVLAHSRPIQGIQSLGTSPELFQAVGEDRWEECAVSEFKPREDHVLVKKGSPAGGVEALAGGGGRPCASMWGSRLIGVNSLLPREVRDESTWQGSRRTHQSGS